MAVTSRSRTKAAVVILLLIGLWFALAQYNNTCTLWRKGALSRNTPGLSKGLAGKQNADGEYNAEQETSMELSSLLKEAMLHGQVGKPTIHLVEIMEGVNRPFLMFVCSNCFCDICDKVRNLGYWSPVESLIFHHVLRRHGCKDGKSLVIDVGAHVGYFSLISASYGCRVVSFEPNSVALRYLNLSRAINNYEQVSLYQKGVGGADTQAMYKQTDTWALNGFLRKRRKLASVDSTPEVLLTGADVLKNSDAESLVDMGMHSGQSRFPISQNLDSAFGRRRLLETVEISMLDSIVDEDVLLMKIDTEGYEANVFTGAKNLLSKHKVHHILVEVKQASSPTKRDLLWTIAKTGGFTHVYNWDEVVTPLSVPFSQFYLQNATIIDVTSIVFDQQSVAPLHFQDFWFCREPWIV